MSLASNHSVASSLPLQGVPSAQIAIPYGVAVHPNTDYTSGHGAEESTVAGEK